MTWRASKWGHDYTEVGGTSPWTGEGRTTQEQLSRVMQEQVPRAQIPLLLEIAVFQKWSQSKTTMKKILGQVLY